MATSSSSSTIATNSGSRILLPSLSNPGDIAAWLHNKLSSDDIWSDKSSIISQLNADMLQSIKSCFNDLQVNVKLKLLLSFLHIPKRNLDEWKNELEELIRIAIDDSDPWVSVVAELLENYPRHNSIDLNPSSSSFSELTSDLKKLVKKQDQKILPLESLFLNRCAFHGQFGQPAQPVKHFQLKRKAKSATLRAELLQKATDVSSGKRSSTGPTVPIRCRGLSDSTPYKGIPSRNSFGSSYSSFSKSNRLSSTSSLSAGFATGNSRSARLSAASNLNSSGMKRDGGIVLLDMNEAPSATNQRDLKRLRKDNKEKEKLEKQQASKTLKHQNSSNNDEEPASSVTQQQQPKSDEMKTQFKTMDRNSSMNRSDSLDADANDENEDSSVMKSPSLSTEMNKLSDNNDYDSNKNNQQSQNRSQSNSSMNSINNSTNQQQRQILGSKSTPDYAAGLPSVMPSSSLLSSTSSTNESAQQQAETSMYDQQPVTTSKTNSSTTNQSSMYHKNSSSNQQQFDDNNNNNQQQQQQQQSNARISTAATNNTSQFQMLNQSIMAQQRFQQQQQSQQQQNEMKIPLQQQMMAYHQQQQQQRNTSFIQQQNSSQQISQQQQQTRSVNNNNNQSFVGNQQNRPQQSQQTTPTSFGMYGATGAGTTQQQPQQTRITISLQGLSPSAEQLMREILTKFPNFNPQDCKTILDFLKGHPNPNPSLGPQRQFRLGETIELRKRSPDQPETRQLVETQLIIDYEKKTCKKLENLKSFPDFANIRLSTVSNNSQQQSNTPQFNAQGMLPVRMTLQNPRVGIVTTNGNMASGTPRMMMTTRGPVRLMAINPSLLNQQQQFNLQQNQPQSSSLSGNSTHTNTMQYSHS